VLVFFVLPFFVVIFYSVVDNPISHQFVFLDNFKMVFNNAAFRQAAANTMKFSAIAVPLAVVLSLGGSFVSGAFFGACYAVGQQDAV